MASVARRLVGSREEAEDLMQEAYARAFRNWRSYTPGTNMRAWLLRILTNLNVDRGRKVQRSPQTQPDPLASALTAPTSPTPGVRPLRGLRCGSGAPTPIERRDRREA